MAEKKDMARLQRARVIRDAVFAADRSLGRWESIAMSGGRTARLRVIDGPGWRATVDTRFSGSHDAVETNGGNGSLLSRLGAPRREDVLVDIYHPQAGKVLSIGSTGGEDTLIGMQPGPWEKAFGLPDRSWSPATERRLAAQAKRAALVPDYLDAGEGAGVKSDAA